MKKSTGLAGYLRARVVIGFGLACLGLIIFLALEGRANNWSAKNTNAYSAGELSVGNMGIQRTTEEIMQTQRAAPVPRRVIVRREHEIKGLKNRPQNPNAKAV